MLDGHESVTLRWAVLWMACFMTNGCSNELRDGEIGMPTALNTQRMYRRMYLDDARAMAGKILTSPRLSCVPSF